MTALSVTLLSLPPELLTEILEYLPADGVVALQLSDPYLNSLVHGTPRLKNKPLSDCSRLMIRTYLKVPEQNPQRARCILCKQNYPVTLFSSNESPACLPTSTDSGPQLRSIKVGQGDLSQHYGIATFSLRPEVLELPSRVCAWHVSRFTNVVKTGPGGKNEWVSSARELCLHCGRVRAWSPCRCTCDTCGVREVRTYVRYLNNDEECKSFVFWRKFDSQSDQDDIGLDGLSGTLFVREQLHNHDATREASINFPVQFRDHDPDSDVIPLQHLRLPSKL